MLVRKTLSCISVVLLIFSQIDVSYLIDNRKIDNIVYTYPVLKDNNVSIEDKAKFFQIDEELLEKMETKDLLEVVNQKIADFKEEDE